MDTSIKLLLAITALSLATTSFGDTTPPPIAKVVALTDEVEVEYLPSVTVEIVHDEVEINGQGES
jgi:hypothetical protein